VIKIIAIGIIAHRNVILSHTHTHTHARARVSLRFSSCICSVPLISVLLKCFCTWAPLTGPFQSGFNRRVCVCEAFALVAELVLIADGQEHTHPRCSPTLEAPRGSKLYIILECDVQLF